MASIDEAKDIIKNTPISSIVTYYHPISKKGGNFEGICPFHGDSHPSLKINDSKGIYKCFACGAAGDSIKFVQDKLNVDFVEAIKDISIQLGITIEEKQFKNKNPKFDIGLRVLQVASKLYKKIALEHKPEHYTAFLKNRNLNEESTQDFQIGYASGGNILVNYLNSIPEKDKNMAITVAKDLGLIRENKRGQGHYDFYRDRVMFPILDHSAKVRGFSSRAVLPDQMPKYLNSGESFIFDKGNILYGFNLAKNHIRELDSVLIVEGNMDAISLHQYGFKNSVATMGVSLSNNSARLLTNMTKNIFLGMDSDNAGIKAMTRINNEFLELDIITKFIDYSPSKDPDEFLNEFGRLELQKKIDEAPLFIDYLIGKEIPESIPESTEKKLAILKNIFLILKPVRSKLMANEKVIQTAKALGLKSSNDDILNEYNIFLENENKKSFKPAKKVQVPVEKLNYESHQHGSAPMPEEPPMYMEEENFGFSEANTPQIQTNKITKEENVLLEALLINPECILSDQITEILDKIQHFEVKRIVQWLKSIYLEIDESEYPLFLKEKMNESLPEEIKSILASGLFKYNSTKLNAKVIDKLLMDLSLKLDEGLLKQERNALRQKQLLASTDEDGLEILNEIQKIELKLNDLRNK